MSGYGFSSTTYDDEDRLTGWNRADNALTKSWSLSAVGDWNSVTENSTTQSRTHGPTHELLTAAGQNVTTDTKGNMTVIPAVLRPGADPLNLTWDMDNRLASADVDNDSVADVSYQWDALGRRVARDDGTTTTVYVQSGQQTIADYASGAAATSPTYTYYYASYIDEPIYRTGTGSSRYYHRTQQYSITALTDANANVTERYAYTAYGTPTITDGAGATLTTSADNNRYMYTGREWDETLSLYHFRARMYDAFSGRFLARDPIGFVNGSSLYRSYFIISLTDPTGLATRCEAAKKKCFNKCKKIDPSRPSRKRLECEMRCRTRACIPFPPEIDPDTGLVDPVEDGENINIWGDGEAEGFDDFQVGGCPDPLRPNDDRPSTSTIPDNSVDQVFIRSAPWRCECEMKEICRICKNGCVVTVSMPQSQEEPQWMTGAPAPFFQSQEEMMAQFIACMGDRIERGGAMVIQEGDIASLTFTLSEGACGKCPE